MKKMTTCFRYMIIFAALLIAISCIYSVISMCIPQHYKGIINRVDRSKECLYVTLDNVGYRVIVSRFGDYTIDNFHTYQTIEVDLQFGHYTVTHCDERK